MKKISQILRDARIEKKYSLQEVEEITKIKHSFIKAIEKGDWRSLPPFPTVLGFVKSLSAVLDINEKTAVAVLKRDYPPGESNINPKPDISSKKIWSPRFAFILGTGLIVISVLGYLGFQYKKFTSPPKVEVLSPIDGQIVSGSSVLVFGSTDADVKITVDNQPVLVDKDGKFSVNINISSSTDKIIIKGVSRSGKDTSIERKIRYNN